MRRFIFLSLFLFVFLILALYSFNQYHNNYASRISYKYKIQNNFTSILPIIEPKAKNLPLNCFEPPKADCFYKKAIFYISQKKAKQAEEALLNAINHEKNTEFPLSFSIRVKLAQSLIQRKSYRKAAKVLATLKEMYPKHPLIYNLTGDFFLKQEKFYRAQFQYQRSLHLVYDASVAIKKNLSLIGQNKSTNREELNMIQQLLKQESSKNPQQIQLLKVLLLMDTKESIQQAKEYLGSLPSPNPPTENWEIFRDLIKNWSDKLSHKDRKSLLLNYADRF